ncbi:VC2046/SO_2500 family protein [Catenovulum adriaticum]|uniref:VC2046/SO_2500 family protein n=1 Tax=Catenovulum adriaticum TaxID=2984846 RepID=A0ABY7ANF7_9ALTE|nr:VC2046/SO_2500 family protein [Catenovulum sp. TS8]WAJ71090.1 VC2046/SO_2500 family protein [Catenovulum sp. TS8]
MSISFENPLNESAFAGRLNQAVNANQRYDFALTLACLSQNVAEQAQFSLPDGQANEENDVESQLKAELGVHTFNKLAADDNAYLTAVNASYTLNQSGILQTKLLTYLQPEALSQFNDSEKLDDTLVANLDRHSLYRLQQADAQNKVNSKPEADATQLYDILNKINHVQVA